MKTTLLRRGLLAALALAGAAHSLVGPTARAAAPDPYTAQRIDWKRCFEAREVPAGLPDGAEALECGSFRVPQDWDRPGAGADLSIAVSRLRPPGGGKGSLLTNPGGPGGPGRTLPLLFLEERRTEVLQNLEIVGIDVRGTGKSTNVTCNRQSGKGTELDPRDRTAENVEAILDGATFVARACQGASGELGRTVTTYQTVRDLDLLRALLGRDKISWLGYSGGTWLGAHYATTFPGRADRFVLDANTEFTGPWQATFERQPLGFQRRFDVDFLPWVAAHGEVFGLGGTAAAVKATYEDVRARLAAQPLLLGDDGTVYAATLDNILAQSLYSADSFQPAADALRFLQKATQPERHGTLRPESSDHPDGFGEWVRRANAGYQMGGPPVAPDADSATFLAITCNDSAWAGDRAGLVASSARAGRAHPLIGWSTLHQPCIFWKRPPVKTPVPTGAGVPPVLMVQTERDPATPVEGARAAHNRFAGSRLLTVTGEGNHGSYAIRGNACVDRMVEAYLLDGVVPADTACAGDVPGPARRSSTPLLDRLDRATAATRTVRLARIAGWL